MAHDKPWWSDDQYVIGSLSTNTRKVRFINTLTKQEHVLTVPAEETCEELLTRYLPFNHHAQSYTWKTLDAKTQEMKELDMKQTLVENEVVDESSKFVDLRIKDDYYVPAIYLYFNDDLTVA
mmetsp:Transcript_44255/g.114987  ORF Transcript_44255/g.114987 Transcript_44255/m.114987 type:complete len:122 (+) Transcript_44255:790-1155(+)